jgi:hypothetical protein
MRQICKWAPFLKYLFQVCERKKSFFCLLSAIFSLRTLSNRLLWWAFSYVFQLVVLPIIFYSSIGQGLTNYTSCEGCELNCDSPYIDICPFFMRTCVPRVSNMINYIVSSHLQLCNGKRATVPAAKQQCPMSVAFH